MASAFFLSPKISAFQDTAVLPRSRQPIDRLYNIFEYPARKKNCRYLIFLFCKKCHFRLGRSVKIQNFYFLSFPRHYIIEIHRTTKKFRRMIFARSVINRVTGTTATLRPQATRSTGRIV